MSYGLCTTVAVGLGLTRGLAPAPVAPGVRIGAHVAMRCVADFRGCLVAVTLARTSALVTRVGGAPGVAILGLV